MDRIDRIIDVVIPLVLAGSVFVVMVSGVMMLSAPREVVSDIHQCSSTTRVVQVSLGDEVRHDVQVWGCVNRCTYWTTATYETREAALVQCHAGEETKL